MVLGHLSLIFTQTKQKLHRNIPATAVSQTVRGRERAVPYLSEQLSFEITQTDCFPGLSFQQEHLLYLYFSAISLCVTPGHSCVYSLNRNGNDFPAAVNPQEKMSSP